MDQSVSVVIPTHRRADMLGRAVNSVLKQTRAPDEIVVVDDAGDEATRHAVTSFDHSCAIPVRYVRNSRGDGPSGSRNLGVAKASGSFIAFLDDDDYWMPTYLAQALAQADAADVVATPLFTIVYDANGREVMRKVRHIPADTTSQDALAHNPGLGGSNMVMRRSDFQRAGGFDIGLWIGEDNDFYFRLLKSGARVTVVPDALAVQVVHTGARLSHDGARRVEGLVALIRKTYGMASPRTRRRMQFGYFDARKEAATRPADRWRFRVYAWSAARPKDLVKRFGLQLRQRTWAVPRRAHHQAANQSAELVDAL